MVGVVLRVVKFDQERRGLHAVVVRVARSLAGVGDFVEQDFESFCGLSGCLDLDRS